MQLSSSQLEDLIESYTSTVRAICRKFYLVGGSQDDLFQEGMIGLFEACKNYDKADYNSSQFKNFAILCIKRQIYDAIKHANKKGNCPLNTYVPINKTNSENEEYDAGYSLPSEAISPEDRFIEKEDYDEKIEICKKNLSKYEISVLDLYLQGERQSQIALKLNKPVKSIDNTIQRIKNKLSKNSTN